MLAASGANKGLRGRLQSHGISGVQDRHDNAYDYQQERREAIDGKLERTTAARTFAGHAEWVEVANLADFGGMLV